MTRRRSIKIEVHAGGVDVFGPQEPMPETGDVQSMVCQQCLADTNKTVVAEIIQMGMIDDQHYLSVRCDRCGHMWTAQFALEHWAYGVIDVQIAGGRGVVGNG